MIVMPANSSGWFWHSLARETSKLGHLFSPGDQRGPWPWFPYALDNGAFSCWEPKSNTFDLDKWNRKEAQWHRMLFWAQSAAIKPLWAIVPDVPGNANATIGRWAKYSQYIVTASIPLAIAVQDGMIASDVRLLSPAPSVICVGGSTEWKWSTVEIWAKEFPRVHLLRCNSPEKLDYLEQLGVESCDGTGWNRGDRKQTSGLEMWCRKNAKPTTEPMYPYVSRAIRCRNQMTFA